MGLSIEDILGKVKPPVRSAWVCLDGELWSRHDELSKEIDARRAEGGAQKMSAGAETVDLSRELFEVQREMRAAEVEFKFRGLSSYKRDEIIKRFPSKDPRMEWDTTAGAHALLSASAVDPEMSEEQATRLVEATHYGAVAKLFNTAWAATEGSADVPFSVRASA